MSLVVLVGASGSGKTTIARAIERRHAESVSVFFFDQIGVPSTGQMIEEFGSPEEWQRAKTIQWMSKLSEVASSSRKALFEGQTRLSFLAEGAAAAGEFAYLPILVDCDDETRTRRLAVDRGQPELANKDMMNWARYLRREAEIHGCEVLDTSSTSVDNSVSWVISRLG